MVNINLLLSIVCKSPFCVCISKAKLLKTKGLTKNVINPVFLVVWEGASHLISQDTLPPAGSCNVHVVHKGLCTTCTHVHDVYKTKKPSGMMCLSLSRVR
jgi:hypothetical protein